MDRDENASINIKQEGLNIIKNTDGQSGINACGECVSPIFDRQYSLKQEKEVLVN
jgi:transposase